ncbi:MAG: hypothetical protein E4H23_09860 [Chrysiogenales bacterium]|nr:MAG: hypothetical protein E4H23_09860 [Chrysiogenales bacterium]
MVKKHPHVQFYNIVFLNVNVFCLNDLFFRFFRGSQPRIFAPAAALVVNGKKQPDAVHERFRKFYETLNGRKLDDKRMVTIDNDKD